MSDTPLIFDDYGFSKRVYDRNGWFEIEDNPVSREGVFPYLGRSLGAPKEFIEENNIEPDKTYYVYRPEQALSHPKFLASLRLVPIIDDHAVLGAGNKPAEEKGVEGVVGERAYFKDGMLYSNIKIWSEDLKSRIDSGKTELSLGYRANFDNQAGIHKGQKYDFIQKDLIANHLALVDNGRMGSQIAVCDEDDNLINDNGENMGDKADDKTKKDDDKSTITMDKADFKEMLDDFKTEVLDSVTQIVKDMKEDTKDMGTHDMGSHEMEDDEKMGYDKKDKKKKKDDDSTDDDMDKKNIHNKGQKALAKMSSDSADDDVTTDARDEKITNLERQVSLMKDTKSRDELAETLSWAVGTFDSADMTLQEVAEYGIKKLDLTSPKGIEVDILKTHLKAVSGSGGQFEKIAMDKTDDKSTDKVDAYISGAK